MSPAARLLRALGTTAAASLPGWRPRRLSGQLAQGWRAYLVHTVTGQLGPAIDPAAGTWAIELNGTESGQVTLRKAELAHIDRKWITPWWASVLLTYSHDGVERPIVAGPITSWPSETDEALVLDFSGIRRILERRIAIRAHSTTIKRDLVYTGESLGGIGWRLVEVAMERPGGGLPIIHGTPDETAGHQRTYEWWNLANNGIDKRLTELSEVIEGPDIMLRPEWTSEAHTAVRWSMVHGTKANPTIAQDRVPDWDTTAARGNVASIAVRSSAEHLAARVWATGAGEGAGTVIEKATDLTLVEAGGPFLEDVISDSDQAKATVIRDKAAAELANRGDMLDQLSLTVRANDPKAPLGLWHVGDKARVTLAGWYSIPDGTHEVRLIRASGDLGHNVNIELQEDAW